MKNSSLILHGDLYIKGMTKDHLTEDGIKLKVTGNCLSVNDDSNVPIGANYIADPHTISISSIVIYYGTTFVDTMYLGESQQKVKNNLVL